MTYRASRDKMGLGDPGYGGGAKQRPVQSFYRVFCHRMVGVHLSRLRAPPPLAPLRSPTGLATSAFALRRMWAKARTKPPCIRPRASSPAAVGARAPSRPRRLQPLHPRLNRMQVCSQQRPGCSTPVQNARFERHHS